ncbi:LacI family DNA-binding transcriptional regulator [Streptomyces sp. NPDC006733]|uniref:LacI family DNA-binding transcriptional regulator n=1 Tax=Streptomyces sp. NPDC006733 TaxID=3155460 RepID=UPI0033FB4393
MKRPTVTDIARRAGVTKGAVSFAVNGKRGVSEHARKRILAIAEELGRQPNRAERALSDGRAGAFGLAAVAAELGLFRPGLTALRRDIAGFGACAARLPGEVVAGDAVADLQVAEMSLVERGSTAAASVRG